MTFTILVEIKAGVDLTIPADLQNLADLTLPIGLTQFWQIPKPQYILQDR